jgi:hypothetical protein
LAYYSCTEVLTICLSLIHPLHLTSLFPLLVQWDQFQQVSLFHFHAWIPSTSWSRGMIQMVEHLSSKPKASNPSAAKQKPKRIKRASVCVCVCVYFNFCFEIGSHYIPQAGLNLLCILDLNSWSSCLRLFNVWVTGILHHLWLCVCVCLPLFPRSTGTWTQNFPFASQVLYDLSQDPSL